MKLNPRPLLPSAALLCACAASDPAVSGHDESASVEETILAQAEQEVVYGEDDRTDVYAHPSEQLRALARESIVALMNPGSLDTSNPDDIQIRAGTLGERRRLCDGERFAEQPTAAFCSGTLIGEDLVLTAGHCIDDVDDCRGTRFVFDYFYAAEGELESIDSDDVYACDDLVARALGGGLDHAVVRLDRPVVGRTPAPVRTSSEPLAEGTELVVIGFGSGLPAKIDDGGFVTESREESGDYFQATVDTFGGNSGSGVFDTEGNVVGILVRGQQDYVTTSEGCTSVNVLPQDRRDSEDCSYVYRAVVELCESGAASTDLCPPETRRWCAFCEPDETVCAGGFQCEEAFVDGGVWSCTQLCESNDDCREDHACGESGICTPRRSEVCEGSDIVLEDACGNVIETVETCADGQLCRGGACVEAGEGNTCATAIDIEPVSTEFELVIDDTYSSDTRGSCAGGGPEIVYTFEVEDEVRFTATATNDDPVLYLRGADCADRDGEIVCIDDSDPPGEYGSSIAADLEAGVYHLFVDGYREGGEYDVALRFTEPCDDVCELGDETCVGTEIAQCVRNEETGCNVFGVPFACAGDAECQDGACVLLCEDACEPFETACADNNSVASCERLPSGCLGFGEGRSCSTNAVCEDGLCVFADEPDAGFADTDVPDTTEPDVEDEPDTGSEDEVSDEPDADEAESDGGSDDALQLFDAGVSGNGSSGCAATGAPTRGLPGAMLLLVGLLGLWRRRDCPRG